MPPNYKDIEMSKMQQGEKAFQDMVMGLLQDKKAHAVNMEPGTTNPGIPDINWCLEGIEGHLELKFGCNGFPAPKIRGTQIVWFRERIKAGGYPMFAYYIEEPDYTDEVYVFQGRYYEHLATAKKLDEIYEIPHLRVMNPMELMEALISEMASWHDELHPQIQLLNS